VNRFRRDRRGQFVILAAVIMAAFMFSLIHTISQISTSRQGVAYEPIDELVLAITSDFERCLTRALAMATQNYSKTWNEESAKICGRALTENWYRALPALYNGFGMNISLKTEGSSGENIGWYINWGDNSGISAVYTTFCMNVETYGLRNLAVAMRKAVRLNIRNWTDTGTIRFKVCLSGAREHYMPISDIAKAELYINGTSYNACSSEYMGRGEYVVQFSLPDNLNMGGSMLMVTTGDGVIVGARIPGSQGGGGGGEGGGSEEQDWRVLYISPERFKNKSKDFMLLLEPEEGQVRPPLNNPFDNRTGRTVETTPNNLTLGNSINITLHAFYSKQGKQGSIDVNVTLAYVHEGALCVIGFKNITISKSSTPLEYNLSFSPGVSTIPQNSIIVLILTRLDNDSGGTLHIICGEGLSRIELW